MTNYLKTIVTLVKLMLIAMLFFIAIVFCSCSGTDRLSKRDIDKAMSHSDWRYATPQIKLSIYSNN